MLTVRLLHLEVNVGMVTLFVTMSDYVCMMSAGGWKHMYLTVVKMNILQHFPLYLRVLQLLPWTVAKGTLL